MPEPYNATHNRIEASHVQPEADDGTHATVELTGEGEIIQQEETVPDNPQSHSPMSSTARSRRCRRRIPLLPRLPPPEEVVQHYIGAMDILCPHCQARLFPGDKYSCCSDGLVALPDYQPLPPLLNRLFTANDAVSTRFLRDIRKINSAVAFASFGFSGTRTTADGAQSPRSSRPGPYCYKVHGQIYHRSSALHPPPNMERRYAQLYILDPDTAADLRSAAPSCDSVDPDMMRQISRMLDEVHPLAAAYKHASLDAVYTAEMARPAPERPQEISMTLLRHQTAFANR